MKKSEAVLAMAIGGIIGVTLGLESANIAAVIVFALAGSLLAFMMASICLIQKRC